MKAWEKWYWGIALVLFVWMAVSILLSKEGVKITKNSQIIYISRGKAFAYFIPIWLSFFVLLWLVIKLTIKIISYLIRNSHKSSVTSPSEFIFLTQRHKTC